MSIRRTQQTVESLWRAFDGQLQPQPCYAMQPSQGSATLVQRSRVLPAHQCDPEYGAVAYHSHVHQNGLVAHEPPRLPQTRGCCSRMLALLCCLLCFAAAGVALALATSGSGGLAGLSGVHAALAPTHVGASGTEGGSVHGGGSGNAADAASNGYADGVHEARRRRRPLPAILRRFAAVRGGRAPMRDHDLAALRQSFPHWRGVDGMVAADAAIDDLALAVVALADQIGPEQPSAQNAQSEGDNEAHDT
jgi:hypothetical protein